MGVSVQRGSCGGEQAGPTNLGDLVAFRCAFYDCLTPRADALFELADAVLCAEGPVSTLVGLRLTAEHRRGHGALYDGLGSGRISYDRLRKSLAGLPVPRDGHGRITLAVDVSPWLRPDAATCADRCFCHVYGRGKGQARMIPGWPYSFVAALETGRTSWTTLLDAVRLGPGEDATEVTAAQPREVVGRLRQAGHWRKGDPEILIVFDAGYDVTAWLTCWPICLWTCWDGSARIGCSASRRHHEPPRPSAARPDTGGSSNLPIRPPTPSPTRSPAPTPADTAPPTPAAGAGCIPD